ncbi:MAG: HD domain-containing protein [Flavobacteriales bacterium]|nr:HD domain-containing protein [Flavobacteriales bacterium]
MNLKQFLSHPLFRIIGEEAREMGVQAFAIGGFVRDLILERPIEDVDIVCDGDGVELAERCASRVQATRVNVYKRFGTAQFVHDGLDWEFVGARKESYSKDSRNPQVEPGSLEDDQRRRDFTMNALAVSLQSANFGEVVDPFDGLKAIASGEIKTPLDPDTTYSDDPLRMMRAVRFAAQLGFHIEEGSFEAISRNAHRISIVSQERITTELNKIIASANPGKGFRLLYHSGLLKLVFPEMEALHGVEYVDGKGHKDNFFHTLEVLEGVAEHSDNLWLRWAAIMHDIAKPPTKRFQPGIGWTFHGHEDMGSRMVPRIFKRMRLPMDHKMRYVKKLVFLHLRPIALTKETITDSAVRRLVFEAGEDIDDLMILCRADITSKNEKKVKRYLANYEKVLERIEVVEEKDRIRNFQPPVTGEDIMEHYGIGPCREIGVIKQAIKDGILEGTIPNERDAAWEFMIQKGQELGLKHP